MQSCCSVSIVSDITRCKGSQEAQGMTVQAQSTALQTAQGTEPPKWLRSESALLILKGGLGWSGARDRAGELRWGGRGGIEYGPGFDDVHGSVVREASLGNKVGRTEENCQDQRSFFLLRVNQKGEELCVEVNKSANNKRRQR